MALESLKKVFSSDIQTNLYPANEFYKNSRVDGGVQPDMEEVEVPQSGGAPGIIENPTKFPIPISERQDTKKSYLVDYCITKATRLGKLNELLVNYNKRQDIVSDHRSQLQTRIADKMGFIWSASEAANIVRTTGANGLGAKAHSVATGTRKEITKEDIIRCVTILEMMNLGSSNFYALISPLQYQELLLIPDFVDYNKTGNQSALIGGMIGELMGVKFYKRTTVPLYDNQALPQKKSYLALPAATDNMSVLFWHPDFVRRAEGVVQVDVEDRPVSMDGVIMNAKVRCGGMISRTDQKGVLSLVQGV